MEIYDKRDDAFDGAFLGVRTWPESEVLQFYENQTIFITGGSGFVGILLIEKLLRTCSNMKKIILLVREKRGKSANSRIREMFDDQVFEKMKLRNPRYEEQIEIIDGCCRKPNLGLTEEQVRKLQSEVNIIFHLAANVRFDEPIRSIFEINVAGTETLLQIAQDIKNLKGFVYVSTAYSQSHQQKIEEKFYPGAIRLEELKQFLKQYDDRTLNILTPKILNGRFNTYTMTKGMAEELVSRYKSTLPIVIFRPTIVTSTFDEPWTNWTNNIYGATGVFFAAGVGFLRTLYCDPDCKAEIIPADRLVNALIVVPKHVKKHWYSSEGENQLNIDPVYNFAMRQDTPQCITWGFVMQSLVFYKCVQRKVSEKMMWVYHLTLDGNYLVWLTKYYILHLLPLPFFVLMERMFKLPPRVRNGYIKLYRHTLSYSFFMTKSWTITQENVLRLYEDLNNTDKVLFNCDVDVDWIAYFRCMCRGLGTFLLKTNWNDEPKHGPWKLIIMYTLDRALVWTCRVLLLMLLWKIVQIVGNRWCLPLLSAEI